MKNAIQSNKTLVAKNYQALKRNPIFGQGNYYNEALAQMKDMNSQLKTKEREFDSIRKSIAASP